MKKQLGIYGAFFALILGLTNLAQAQPSVALTGAPASQTIMAGNTATYTINLTRKSYTDKVTLSTAGLPAGVTAVFSPNPALGTTSTLTLTTSTATPVASHSIKINGTAQGLTIAPVFLTLTVTTYRNVSVTSVPETRCVMAGQPAEYTLNITRTNYDGLLSFTVQGAPAESIITFDPPTTYGNQVKFRIIPPMGLLNELRDLEIIARGNGIESAVSRSRLLVSCGVQWNTQFGGPGSENGLTPSYETQNKVAIDNAGNAYSTGNTNGTVDNGGANNAGSTDVWVAKFDTFGNQVWIRQFGGPAEDRATEIVADNLGNIYVAGYTGGRIDPTTTTLGNFDLWLAKFDAMGNRLWIRQTGTPFADGPYGIELRASASGVTLNSVTRDRTQLSVERYDSNGNRASNNSFGLIRPPYWVNEMTVAGDGSVFVVGHNPSQTNSFAWVRKYGANGGELWSADLYPNESRVHKANRVTTDASGNVYVSGCSNNVPPTSAGQSSCSDSSNNQVTDDAWVIKLDGNGNEAWTSNIITPQKDIIGGLATDSAGNLFMLGHTRGLLITTLFASNAGGYDVWLGKLDGVTGNVNFYRQFGTNGDDLGLSLAVHPYGGLLYLAGSTTGNLGGMNRGSTDAWVMQYNSISNCFF